ncbi:hypothetical protein [Candidatus Nanohalococcus occultus]|uniref:UBA domain-containing protein n=1 Tax=Candidatus Nanohalococcus occultus TaxID=2978047 RepID=A0ABY8CD12_9ARCH|nr:hypothetical protein SVXNc_0080 [Candidatus Nanohaloarchaeota archaeon SVXNc]
MGLPETVAEALTPGQKAQVENALRDTQGDVEAAMDYALGDGSKGYEQEDKDY